MCVLPFNMELQGGTPLLLRTGPGQVSGEILRIVLLDISEGLSDLAFKCFPGHRPDDAAIFHLYPERAGVLLEDDSLAAMVFHNVTHNTENPYVVFSVCGSSCVCGS